MEHLSADTQHSPANHFKFVSGVKSTLITTNNNQKAKCDYRYYYLLPTTLVKVWVVLRLVEDRAWSAIYILYIPILSYADTVR